MLSPKYSLVLSHPSRIGAAHFHLSLAIFSKRIQFRLSSGMIVPSASSIYRFCFGIVQRCR
ncbi:unnamed protein product [Brassica oleracea var. botrytis]|uniref:(rape) hypothetical protein n=1 Tax=Brassica napus TaxID=3708 RepID=A0A816QGG5_BRANA|nr:unnamed protein product [Brassica napus]